MFPTRGGRAAIAWLGALSAYVLLVCGLTWPLPRLFQTHLLGDTSGDVGIYVWNLWIFRHELVEHGHLPLSTDHVFAYTDGLDFALHNYTPLAGLAGVPLMDWLGIVGTFNVVLIAFVTSSALGTMLLARRLGLSPLFAWCAGAIFVASPTLTARGPEHFSLITAAPLPLFLWALLRTLDTRRYGDAVLVGTAVAAATYADAYYGIYCALAGSLVVAWRFVRVHIDRPRRGSSARVVEALIACLAGAIAWRLATGSPVLVIGPVRLGMSTLYTPVFLLTILAAVRALQHWRPSFTIDDQDGVIRVLARRGAAAVAVTLVLLTPVLMGIAERAVDGRLPDTETRWRSSPPGVDLLAYLVPNPLHPLFGDTTRRWLGIDVGFPEFVASFSMVALLVVAAGAALKGLPRFWMAFTAAFVLLSAGPFMYLAGVNTFVPGPWAILRYVPVVGMARSPSRFAIVAVLGLSLLFAFALRACAHELARSRAARYRPVFAGAVLLALVFELVPSPRPLYSADVPAVYQMIRAGDDEKGRVLELPTGIRDGTSTIGKLTAASQFFQTRHRRPMVGGYVSRVSRWRKRENRRSPVLSAIFLLSEGRPLPVEAAEAAEAARDGFLKRTCVRFVVVNKRHASAELHVFARERLRMTLVHEDNDHQLLMPIDPPACEPRTRRGHGRGDDVAGAKNP